MIETFVPRQQEVRAKRIAPVNAENQVNGESTWLALIGGAYIELSTAAFSAIFEPRDTFSMAPIPAASKAAKPKPAVKQPEDGKLGLADLVHRVLESGELLPRELVKKVIEMRPTTTEGSIMSTIYAMTKDGRISRMSIAGTNSYRYALTGKQHE